MCACHAHTSKIRQGTKHTEKLLNKTGRSYTLYITTVILYIFMELEIFTTTSLVMIAPKAKLGQEGSAYLNIPVRVRRSIIRHKCYSARFTYDSDTKELLSITNLKALPDAPAATRAKPSPSPTPTPTPDYNTTARAVISEVTT